MQIEKSEELKYALQVYAEETTFGDKQEAPKLVGESPSGKANRLLCTEFKEGSCQKGNLVMIGLCLNEQRNQTTSRMQVRRQVCLHTAKPADEKTNSAIFANYNKRSDERQMQLQKILSDDKTQFRVRLQHLANRCVLKRYWIRNPNAPTFEDTSIAWTLHMEEMALTYVGFWRKNVCKIPGSYAKNRHKFFKPSPESNVS